MCIARKSPTFFSYAFAIEILSTFLRRGMIVHDYSACFVHEELLLPTACYVWVMPCRDMTFCCDSPMTCSKEHCWHSRGSHRASGHCLYTTNVHCLWLEYIALNVLQWWLPCKTKQPWYRFISTIFFYCVLTDFKKSLFLFLFLRKWLICALVTQEKKKPHMATACKLCMRTKCM